MGCCGSLGRAWVAAASWAVLALESLGKPGGSLGCIDEQACHAALCSGVCDSLATLENKQNKTLATLRSNTSPVLHKRWPPWNLQEACLSHTYWLLHTAVKRLLDLYRTWNQHTILVVTILAVTQYFWWRHGAASQGIVADWRI